MAVFTPLAMLLSKVQPVNKPVLLVAEPPENTKSVGSLLGSIVDL